MRSIAVVALGCLAAMGCSKTSGGGSSADVSDRLAELSGRSGTVLVVRDTADMYWAVPTSGIRHVGGRTLTVQVGTTVAEGKGEASAEAVAQVLLYQWPDGGPYFMTMSPTDGDTVMIVGAVGETTEEILLEVEEVVITRAE